MRTRILAIAALVGASAFTINAQTPEQQRPQTPGTPPSISDTAQKAGAAAGNQAITVTGCLKEEKPTAGANPGSASQEFVLTDVKMAPGSSTSGIGVATKYQVKGVAEVELKKHIDHQVEITGRVAQAPAGGAAAASDIPDFQATSVKMVAATCSAK